MNSATHTPEQLTLAERVSTALANVPSNKRPELEALVEMLLTGASIDGSVPADGEK